MEPSVQRSLSQRRDSGVSLNKLVIPPLDTSQEVIVVPSGIPRDKHEEVVEEGRELFTNFVSSEIQRVPNFSYEDIPLRTPPGYKDPLWAKTGRDLRLMADDFSKTRGRAQVQRRAEQVGTDVTFEQFHDLLSQIFCEGGITRERIVVLFFFCSDVAIQALRAGKNLFMTFLNWSLTFISEKICTWVYQHGGWGQVVAKPFNSVNKFFLWAAVVGCLFLLFRYYRKKLL
ncbi:apoptosis regulator BAX [Aplysia californica]|uniref:Apoptosis regulator BAX n=1 Tax=Aplysia californica TaxID=6500 RepID=A0ABM0JSX3_APLCA|nr:apoptosis regulator BAX [Aplysia californica]